jgi:orotate phosphoribosyltransferase
VLLFDDVTTTGATLAACALALLAAGAERVDALVLARAWRSAAGPPGAPASQPAPEPLP